MQVEDWILNTALQGNPNIKDTSENSLEVRLFTIQGVEPGKLTLA